MTVNTFRGVVVDGYIARKIGNVLRQVGGDGPHAGRLLTNMWTTLGRPEPDAGVEDAARVDRR